MRTHADERHEMMGGPDNEVGDFERTVEREMVSLSARAFACFSLLFLNEHTIEL